MFSRRFPKSKPMTDAEALMARPSWMRKATRKCRRCKQRYDKSLPHDQCPG